MTEQARQAQREYQRQWRQAHPDRVREYRRRYWERKAQEAAGTSSTSQGEEAAGR